MYLQVKSMNSTHYLHDFSAVLFFWPFWLPFRSSSHFMVEYLSSVFATMILLFHCSLVIFDFISNGQNNWIGLSQILLRTTNLAPRITSPFPFKNSQMSIWFHLLRFLLPPTTNTTSPISGWYAFRVLTSYLSPRLLTNSVVHLCHITSLAFRMHFSILLRLSCSSVSSNRGMFRLWMILFGVWHLWSKFILNILQRSGENNFHVLDHSGESFKGKVSFIKFLPYHCLNVLGHVFIRAAMPWPSGQYEIPFGTIKTFIYLSLALQISVGVQEKSQEKILYRQAHAMVFA